MVLFITKNLDLADRIKEDLDHEGFALEILEDLQKVYLQLYQNSQYWMILLDLESFGEEVYEICQKIKADIHLKFIPIIGVIEKSRIAEKLLAFEMGTDDFIVIPYSPLEIQIKIRALHRLIDLQKNLQEKEIQIENLRKIQQIMVTLNHYINNALTPLYSFIQMMNVNEPQDAQRLKEIAEKSVKVIMKILDTLQKLIESGEFRIIRGGIYQDLLLDIESKLKELKQTD